MSLTIPRYSEFTIKTSFFRFPLLPPNGGGWGGAGHHGICFSLVFFALLHVCCNYICATIVFAALLHLCQNCICATVEFVEPWYLCHQSCSFR